MGIIIVVVFGLITALLAGRKGYSPACWFLAAGALGLLILAFLPFVNDKSKLPEVDRASRKMTGNIIGGAISTIAVIILFVGLAGR